MQKAISKALQHFVTKVEKEWLEVKHRFGA
jgi:hypothetical protein